MKRKRQATRGIKETRTPTKRRPDASEVLPLVALKQPLGLLDLPAELLLQIFVVSASSNFPESCKYLYELCCANPAALNSINGPPMWMQREFVNHTNPTRVFAINKCLRRRFFGPEIFKLYLPELIASNDLSKLSVPLRLAKPVITVRELMLFTELFLAGVQISKDSKNKALLLLASHPTVDRDALFWKCSNNNDFWSSTIARALHIAAQNRSYGPGCTFRFLVQKFGIDEGIGRELYEVAIRHRDEKLLGILRSHSVAPDMTALRMIAR